MILTLGTIIRNNGPMNFGKNSVPANVYLCIVKVERNPISYTAKVIAYKRDKSAVVAPKLGYEVTITNSLINSCFDVITRVVSKVNITPILQDVFAGCKTITIRKNSIYLTPKKKVKKNKTVEKAKKIIENFFRYAKKGSKVKCLSNNKTYVISTTYREEKKVIIWMNELKNKKNKIQVNVAEDLTQIFQMGRNSKTILNSAHKFHELFAV